MPSAEPSPRPHPEPPFLFPLAVARARRARARAPPANATPALNGIAQAMLAVLRRVAPAALTWRQTAVLARRSPLSGPFYAAKRQLRDAGAVKSDGDQVRAAGRGGQGVDRAAALVLWRDALDGFAPRMLDVLADGDWTSREQMGAAMSVSTQSGPWYGGLKALRVNGLSEESGQSLRLAVPLPGETA